MGLVSCPVCEVFCNSPSAFCEHLTGLKHRALMARHHPKDLPQQYRVQYILDTYMQSYPILGLEYVAEMRGETSCYYTCELCKVGRDWREMIIHVTGMAHAKLFIQQHYSHMADNSDLPEEDQWVALRENIKAIFNKEGQKKIRMLEPGALNLPATVVSPSFGKDNGALPPAGQYSVTPQKRAAKSESERLWKFNGQRVVQMTKDCNVCSLSCNSTRTLLDHLMGNRHKSKLKLIAPEDVKKIPRLSYFLRQHVKEESILGLEYVQEVRDGTAWRFFCQLCNIMTNKVLRIIDHVTHEGHTVSYIKKHHADLWTPGLQNCANDKNFLILLREISVKILKEHGAKSIEVILAPHAIKILQDKLKKASEASRKDDARPSKYENRKSSLTKRRPPPSREMERRDGYKKALKKSEVDYPPLAKRGRLYRDEDREALPSRSHKSKRHTKRHARSNMFCLQEYREASPSNPDMSLPRESQQTERHARSDMFDLEEDQEASPSTPDTSLPRDSPQTERHGRSDMFCLEEEQESSPSRSDTSQQTMRYARSTIFCLEEEQESSPPRSDTSDPMDLHPPTEDAALEATTAIQELEFHTNAQLLDYLANFQIDDNEDAAFIQVITQNCIKALTRFQEEEAERLGITRQHEALLASASRVVSVNEARSPSPEPETTSDPSFELFTKNDITETPEVLVNEARSPSSDLETELPVDTTDQSLKLLPKNDITDFFFRSIKDMDESEVVGVFQRIATTNPKFQGMDIPTVIRIVKESGRLKKS
ncbi:uncharacterized protein ACMZJ9_006915 [Mantella aurantiaca]